LNVRSGERGPEDFQRKESQGKNGKRNILLKYSSVCFPQLFGKVHKEKSGGIINIHFSAPQYRIYVFLCSNEHNGLSKASGWLVNFISINSKNNPPF
jgi:hypothetical protein